LPTLVAELGVPLWATGQALGSHCSSRGAEKPPFPRKIEIWRDIGGGSHYFRRPQSYPITRPPPPSGLAQKKPRPDQVTFSVFAPSGPPVERSPAIPYSQEITVRVFIFVGAPARFPREISGNANTAGQPLVLGLGSGIRTWSWSTETRHACFKPAYTFIPCEQRGLPVLRGPPRT